MPVVLDFWMCQKRQEQRREICQLSRDTDALNSTPLYFNLNLMNYYDWHCLGAGGWFSSFPLVYYTLTDLRRRWGGQQGDVCPRLGHSESLLLHQNHWPYKIHPWDYLLNHGPLSLLPLFQAVNERILTTQAIDRTHNVYCSNALAPDATQIINYHNHQG